MLHSVALRGSVKQERGSPCPAAEAAGFIPGPLRGEAHWRVRKFFVACFLTTFFERKISAMQLVFRWCLVLTLVTAAAGCGSSGNNKVYPVKGTVKFEGQPMKGGGSISFRPTGGQVGAAPGGEIKEDGTYELMTYEPGDGSMPGEFRVVITQVTVKEPEASPDGSAPKPVDGPNVAPQDQIPFVYSDPTESPLTAKVEEKSNAIDFDLTRQ